MVFECLHCKKTFPLAAEQITIQTTVKLKTYVCPHCLSFNITEEQNTPEDIESVYVYDLTTGPQTKLDELLAAGWKITGRYSKQYILEKPKPQPQTTVESTQ